MKKIKNIITYCLMIIYLNSCQEKEKVFYNSGELKIEANLIDGKKEGESFEYYKNGDIKARQYWKDDLPHGEGIHYYPNGKFKFAVNWKNGMRHGKHIEYYESGQIKSEGNYDNDIKVGSYNFFYKNGTRMEVDYYDSAGRVFDFEKYDSIGAIRKDRKSALLFLSKDTVKIGEEIVLKGYLGNNEHTVTMVIGTKFNEEGVVEDTLGVVLPKINKDGCM